MLFAIIISWGLYQTEILPLWTPILLTCLMPVQFLFKMAWQEKIKRDGNE